MQKHLLPIWVGAFGFVACGNRVEFSRASLLANFDFVSSESERGILEGVWSVQEGAQNVPLYANLEVQLGSDINTDRINNQSMKVIRASTGEALLGTVKFENGTLKFIPKRTFLLNEKTPDGMVYTGYTGLKAGEKYKLELGDVYRVSGEKISDSGKSIAFETVPLDFGLYWLGDNGEFQKFMPGERNQYFDAQKPTVIGIHGWQNGTSQFDMSRDVPFFHSNSVFGSENTIGLWRSNGYNVGVYFWGQFADEAEARDAEVKVWMGNNTQTGKDGGTVGMRYRTRSGAYNSYPETRSVAELFASECKQAFANFEGSEIRFLGHSLGAQLAGHTAYLLAQEASVGMISQRIVPTRIALLDAFWSKGGKSYLQGKSTGEVAYTEMSRLVSEHDIALEQVKSSALGGTFAGDVNLPMRSLSAFHRVFPRFIPTTDQRNQHVYSYAWYVRSMAQPLASGKGFAGAAASDSEVKLHMNAHRGDSPVHWKQVAGENTSSTQDDIFEETAGVNPW